MPVLINGQQIIHKGPKTLPEQKFKPGQAANLLKVRCINDKFDAANSQADYSINTFRSLINFPEMGEMYTVCKKTSDGYYLLLELGQRDNYWSSKQFEKIIGDVEVFLPIDPNIIQ